MDKHLADLADALFDCGAFKDYRQSENEQGFKLDIHKTKPETPLSPFYISLRMADHPVEAKRGTITPAILEAMGQELYRQANASKLKYDAFTGLPDAGVPLAVAFEKAHPKEARKSHLRLHKRIRIKEDDGPRFDRVVEGDRTIKQRVLLIDDLVSYGGTKGEAAGLLRKEFRMVVEDCLVLIDRRPRTLRDQLVAGLKIHTVFLIEDLIAHYVSSGMMPQDIATRITDYLEAA